MQKFTLLILFFYFTISGLVAQEETTTSWQKLLDDLQVKTSVNLQMWAVYTTGMEVYDNDRQAYFDVDDRLNFTLHRSRYGLNLQPYENLKFNFTLAADFVGRDALSALDAGQNNGGNPVFRLWQTYAQWRMTPKQEKAFLTVGYFSPRVGLESMINPLNSTSMEKAWSQNYLRRHLVGTGPGRAVGMNLGGLLLPSDQILSLKYDFGLFTPVYQAYSGNSTGSQSAPLVTARAVIMIGEPESQKYSMGHKPNHFGKRKGISLGLAAAAQGNTDLYENSLTYGFDVLLNLGNLNFDGDWHFLSRKLAGQTAEANTGYVRVSYNYPLKNGYILEPTATLVQYRGGLEESEQAIAALTGMPAGEDEHIDLGVNFYFNPKLKLALHYTLRDGDAGFSGDGSTVNNFFVSGAGQVRYGDWFGLGLSAAF